MSNFLLNEVSSGKIKELLDEGWEFMLHYGDHRTFCPIDGPSWEADFTRKKRNGKWDNHRCGYGADPDTAVAESYNNIKNGIKL